VIDATAVVVDTEVVPDASALTPTQNVGTTGQGADISSHRTPEWEEAYVAEMEAYQQRLDGDEQVNGKTWRQAMGEQIGTRRRGGAPVSGDGISPAFLANVKRSWSGTIADPYRARPVKPQEAPARPREMAPATPAAKALAAAPVRRLPGRALRLELHGFQAALGVQLAVLEAYLRAEALHTAKPVTPTPAVRPDVPRPSSGRATGSVSHPTPWWKKLMPW
jgi:hypothetical protein